MNKLNVYLLNPYTNLTNFIIVLANAIVNIINIYLQSKLNPLYSTSNAITYLEKRMLPNLTKKKTDIADTIINKKIKKQKKHLKNKIKNKDKTNKYIFTDKKKSLKNKKFYIKDTNANNQESKFILDKTSIKKKISPKYNYLTKKQSTNNPKKIRETNYGTLIIKDNNSLNTTTTSNNNSKSEYKIPFYDKQKNLEHIEYNNNVGNKIYTGLTNKEKEKKINLIKKNKRIKFKYNLKQKLKSKKFFNKFKNNIIGNIFDIIYDSILDEPSIKKLYEYINYIVYKLLKIMTNKEFNFFKQASKNLKKRKKQKKNMVTEIENKVFYVLSKMYANNEPIWVGFEKIRYHITWIIKFLYNSNLEDRKKIKKNKEFKRHMRELISGSCISSFVILYKAYRYYTKASFWTGIILKFILGFLMLQIQKYFIKFCIYFNLPILNFCFGKKNPYLVFLFTLADWFLVLNNYHIKFKEKNIFIQIYKTDNYKNFFYLVFTLFIILMRRPLDLMNHYLSDFLSYYIFNILKKFVIFDEHYEK